MFCWDPPSAAAILTDRGPGERCGVLARQRGLPLTRPASEDSQGTEGHPIRDCIADPSAAGWASKWGRSLLVTLPYRWEESS